MIATRHGVANGRIESTTCGSPYVPANLAQITLPTGVGKTITGTGAGLMISNIRDSNGRLIYILPYTSIIDQTVEEFEKIFDIDAFGDLLTIHHHLAETVTSIDTPSSEDKHASREYLLGETWNAASVVSTYVQLFETLVKPTSQSSIKLPSLYNSTIILDEPQTLPLKWWPLIRRVTETLIEEYNATVISMTATQPRLFTSERCRFDVVDLVDDPEQYFEAVERVEYELDHSVQAFLEDGEDAPQLGHQEAAARLLAGVSGEETSALSICNTIDSATQLSQKLSMEIGGCERTEIAIGDLFAGMAAEGNYDAGDLKDRVFSRLTDPDVEDPIVTLTLTTRHRPIDRQVMLDVATDLSMNTGVPFIFVATQLVEAGVDVSFSRVYRDIAPITSIVQAAGRCNRSAEFERGTVTVWRLEPTDMSVEDPTPPSELVYGAGGENDDYGTLHPTVRAIDHVLDEAGETSAGVIPEVTLARDAVEKFYHILDTEKNVGKERWVGWVDDAKFGELRDLSLIEEKDEHDTIVCRSPEEAQQGRELFDLLGEPDPSIAALKESRELMETLDRCRVSIPENKVEGAGPLHGRPVDLGYGVAFMVFDSDGKGSYSPRYGLQK